MPGELIFLVDDDDAVRTSLDALLETAGYRTAQFESGVDFLESPDVGLGACVLLHVKMPGPDGLEVQRRLNDRGETLPVVILTGHGDIAMAVQAMRAGAVDFLEKPVSREQLLESVGRAIDVDRSVRRDERLTTPSSGSAVSSRTVGEMLRVSASATGTWPTPIARAIAKPAEGHLVKSLHVVMIVSR